MANNERDKGDRMKAGRLSGIVVGVFVVILGVVFIVLHTLGYIGVGQML